MAYILRITNPDIEFERICDQTYEESYELSLNEVMKGNKGDTFIPSVSEDGVISWTNDGGRENPDPINIRGPRGAEGEKGEKGERGEKGETGSKGERGEKGDKGERGEQGPQGEKGDTGEKGEQGEQGPKGDKGDTGDTGPKGDKGDKGNTGETGATGPAGPQGIQGPQGPQGPVGPPGPTNYPDLENLPFINGHMLVGNKSSKDLGLDGEHPYISLERLEPYLYRVTFDSLPEDNGGIMSMPGGCSSYVKDGKLHTNLDWDYDNTASFIVVPKDFEGQSFIEGLNDGNLNDEQIAQLPYRLHRGVNRNGISLAAHVLYNDWSWTGCGNRSINLTRLPFIVLSKVKSMETIASDLNGVLNNLYCPEGLVEMEYLLQLIVTDGTTTYAIMPPVSAGQPYILQDITSNPKLANFRWVNRETVSRSDSDIQRRPTGIERWNMMPCSLEDLRFTKAYESPDRLSEFIGLRGTTKESTDAQLLAIYNDARTEYQRRTRNGKTWQTMESSIYGTKMESLWIQENWQDNILECSVTKEYVDSEIKRVEDEIPTKVSELENDAEYVSEAPSDDNIYGRENKQWQKAAYEQDVEWGDF